MLVTVHSVSRDHVPRVQPTYAKELSWILCDFSLILLGLSMHRNVSVE